MLSSEEFDRGFSSEGLGIEVTVELGVIEHFVLAKGGTLEFVLLKLVTSRRLAVIAAEAASIALIRFRAVISLE